ncbi:MAG: leucine-rich repeat protein [Bacteroidales bacterium]|nr:leucine-rich repeat protein [Bacteroidales bacterium]
MKRLALFICTLLCANVLLAQSFTIGDFRYTVRSYSDGTTGVAVYAADTTITTANIPETVTYEGVTYTVIEIGYKAFENCRNLTSVTIPKGVLSIDCYSFVGCTNLRVLNYNAECYIGNLGRFFGYDDPEEYHFFRDCPINEINIGEDVRKIPAYFAYNLDSLTSITISDGVDSIMIGAFKNCSNLTSINIPNSVTYIARSMSSWGLEHPFEGCSSLTSMTIDMSNIVGDSTYSSNSGNQYTYESPFNIPSLQNLTLGENVTSIASGAFNGCSFLQNVTCLATNPPTLADNTVFPYPNIASLNVPCGTLEAYSSATSFWNMFFSGRISENGYNVEVSVNDETFGSVAVESDCSTATLTATANEGYVFLSWNDGNTDNPRTVALTSDTSFTAIFALIDNSSLSEDAEFAELSVYPNPTRGKVMFSQAIEKVEVIDLSGKTLQTYENANEINIEALPAGVYHLRMTIEDKTTTRKIIKE